MRYLLVLALLMAGCSDVTMVTVTCIALENRSSTVYSDVRVYANDNLEDVVPNGDTTEISVEDGATLRAEYTKTVLTKVQAIREYDMVATTTASDGLVWKMIGTEQ